MTGITGTTAGADDKGDRPRAQRRDIQGLRALAVGLVLVYHLRPERLPGGFIGVDVFFVISGFLIIGTLTDEIRRTGRLGLLDFYARRIRRLLPAASVVLLATVAGTLLLMPMPRWPSVLREVVASALNVQNWLLAVFSADYAHATAAASPVQHFWSLSVEEQFYLVIPVILVISVVVGRRSGRAIRCAFAAVTLVTVASLTYSVLVTTAPAGPAYFVTPTRVWELGIGGLAAMVGHRVRAPRAIRVLLGWGGLAAVLIGAMVLSTSMAFPGWVALAPTLGTVGLLVAGAMPDGRRAAWLEVATPLGLRPLRYLGDISYSLYLWHWPVIVLVLERAGADRLTTTQVVKVGVLSLVLAAASKHLVEDPFRRRRRARTGGDPALARRPWLLRRRPTYLVGASLVLVTVVAATVPWQVAGARIDALERAASMLDADHPGALALDPGNSRPAPGGVALVPDPAVADRDIAVPWKDNCGIYDLANSPKGNACVYGDKRAARTMVLVGDSHMTQFSTALIDFAERSDGWRVKVMVHDGCPFGDLPPDRSGYPLRGCAVKAHELLAAVLEIKPDLVVTSGFTLGFSENGGKRTWDAHDRLVDGYRVLLRPLSDAGIRIAAIRDVPHMTTNTPRCLQRNPAVPSACDTPREVALSPAEDPLVDAVRELPGTTVADLTDWLCTPAVCPAVVGNVVVYRDNHLTDTYVRTLTAPLTAQLGLR